MEINAERDDGELNIEDIAELNGHGWRLPETQD